MLEDKDYKYMIDHFKKERSGAKSARTYHRQYRNPHLVEFHTRRIEFLDQLVQRLEEERARLLETKSNP